MAGGRWKFDPKRFPYFFFLLRRLPLIRNMPLQVKEGQAILSQVKKRLSSVLTDMYSSTIYSKTQAFETFSLHFLEKRDFCWNTR